MRRHERLAIDRRAAKGIRNGCLLGCLMWVLLGVALTALFGL